MLWYLLPHVGQALLNLIGLPLEERPQLLDVEDLTRDRVAGDYLLAQVEMARELRYKLDNRILRDKGGVLVIDGSVASTFNLADR